MSKNTNEILARKLKELQADASLSPGAKEFVNLMNLAETDESVAKKLAELGAGTSEELIAYGKEKGCVFNEQDMKDVGKIIMEPSDELNEEELKKVAGGAFPISAIAVCAVVVAASSVVTAVTSVTK